MVVALVKPLPAIDGAVVVDPDEAPIRWAAAVGADRVELYTEPFARAFERSPDAARTSLARYVEASTLARSLGLGVNAGHDLDLLRRRLRAASALSCPEPARRRGR